MKVLLLILFTCCFCSCMKQEEIYNSSDKMLSIKVSADSEGIICLSIDDKTNGRETKEKTLSSIYQHHSIKVFHNKAFLFKSSDTGNVMFQYQDQAWLGQNTFIFESPNGENIIYLCEKQNYKDSAIRLEGTIGLPLDNTKDKQEEIVNPSEVNSSSEVFLADPCKIKLMLYLNEKKRLITLPGEYDVGLFDQSSGIISWVNDHCFLLRTKAGERKIEINIY